jgi:membrane protease YdiL (CAAX protease family)
MPTPGITPEVTPEEAGRVWGRAPSPVQAERSSAETTGQSSSQFSPVDNQISNQISRQEPSELAYAASPVLVQNDPAWNGLDIVRLIVLTIVALFIGVFAAMFIARWLVYPHAALGEIARVPLVVVAGQSLAYLLILAYMYILVTRERRRPDFLAAIHWNWPSYRVHILKLPIPVVDLFLLAGFVLSVALQILAHFLPIPKELPIDNFFRTPAEAWVLGIVSVALAPLMEELFFRAFLYPVLARRLGLPIAVVLTALAFAALHGAQLMFSWGPVLVIFLVGLVLTIVRAKTNSVAASVLIHMAYNGTITVAMFAATDGFRHLEKLNQ